MSTDSRVRIVVDSAVSLPREVAEEHGLIVVPMEVVFEGRAYRDGLDMEASKFYQRLASARELPTTSAPNPSAFLDAFKQAGADTGEVLCLTVASRFSTTYNSARLAIESAAKEIPDLRVELLDTSLAAAAEALVALEASRCARSGASLEEVKARAEEVSSRVSLLAVLDTLYYLWKGGRVPIVGHWITSVLQIKPMLELSQKGVRMIERPRRRERATRRLLEIMRRRVGDRKVHCIVAHAHCLEEAQGLLDKVSSEFQCKETLMTEFSPVLGTHTGPGLLGVAFWPE